MRTRRRILPYKQSSGSARKLSDALGIPRLRLVRTRFRPRPQDIILNWGYHAGPFTDLPVRWLNRPQAVAVARDKLATFVALDGVPTVEWTTDREVAQSWGATVYVRHSRTGQGGSGIEVVREGPLPRAPLYTKKFRATHEYRIHSFGSHCYVSKKRRRNGAEQHDVRNHANGYVYCTNNVEAPSSVLLTATMARMALGLDFCAVDILCTDSEEARVLEVNTAPGLEGSTLDWYVDRIKGVIG